MSRIRTEKLSKGESRGKNTKSQRNTKTVFCHPSAPAKGTELVSGSAILFINLRVFKQMYSC